MQIYFALLYINLFLLSNPYQWRMYVVCNIVAVDLWQSFHDCVTYDHCIIVEIRANTLEHDKVGGIEILD